MLELTAKKLHQEARGAETWALDNLSKWSEQVARYHTSAFRKIANSSFDAYPENYYFSYVTDLVSRIAQGAPRARVGTTKEGPQEERALALQYGWDRWAKDTNYKREREKFATDLCFAWPVMMVSLKPQPGMTEADDPLTLPAITRISPRRFFWDPYALTMEECRYLGHIVIRDKEDVRKEAEANPKAGWNLDVLDNMSEDAGVKELRNIKQYTEALPTRKEIIYYELVVFEAPLPDGYSRDDGYNAMVYTVPRSLPTTKGMADKFLREPRPLFCPRGGPYNVGSAYTVPDQPAGLAPLVAAEEQITELNAHVRAANRAAARRKSVALVDGLKPMETAKIVNAQDGDVIAVKGLDKSKVVEIETGGVTQEQVAWNLELRGRVDRNLGMSDAIRGQTTAGVTATAEAVANANSNQRGGFIEDKFNDFEKRGAKMVMWFMEMSESTVFHLGPEASQATGNPGALFIGGNDLKESMRRATKHGLIEPELAKRLVAVHKESGASEKEGSGTTFDDLEIEIQSVRDDGSAQAQMAALGQQIVPILPLIGPTASFFDWPQWFRKLGEAYDMPELGRMIDPNAAGQQFQAMQQAAQGQPGQGQPQGVQIGQGAQGPQVPRLSRDIGHSPVPGWAGTQQAQPATPGGTPKPKGFKPKAAKSMVGGP